MRRWGMQLPHLAPLLLTLLLAAPARATDLALDAAQAHTTTGQTFFTNGKFPEARIEFEAAYGLSKEPDLLFNIALAWEREGLVREAIGAYERYLLARPSDLDTKAKVERIRLAMSPPPTQLTEEMCIRDSTSNHHTNYRQTSKGNPTTTPAAPSEPKAIESARVVEARLAVDCA